MEIMKRILLIIVFIVTTPVMAADHTVEMLSSSNGEINEELKITFNKEGVYGYKCTPHYILGMVGIIAVGNNLTNLSASSDFAVSEEKKFATNKDRFSSYINQLK